MKTEIEKKLETVDEMLCGMIMDTYIQTLQINTGKEKFIVLKRPLFLKEKSFFNKNVHWIFYHQLDDRIKYSIDVLSNSPNYSHDDVLFL